MKNTEIFCNKCGRKLKSENGILQEDALFVAKEWGYFSKKDLYTHRFCLCESCYDDMLSDFCLPAEISEKTTAVD